MTRNEITQDLIKEILHYDPETGIFTWKVAGGNNRKRHYPGERAGCTNGQEYESISVFGVKCASHRLAFMYMSGKWPVEEVDHINRIKTDNRWSNLRECTRIQNRNNLGTYKSNTNGTHGLAYIKKADIWVARISDGKKWKYVGFHKDKRVAEEMRRKAQREKLKQLWGK